MNDAELNNLRIGKILRRRRDELDLTLKDICDKLGYKYANFISMIENGNSNIPLARIADFADVYELDNVFIPVVIKYSYESTWTAIKDTFRLNKSIFKPNNIDKIDSDIETAFKNFLIDHDLIQVAE